MGWQTMKMRDVRQMTKEEIEHAFGELQKEKLNLHVQAKTGQLKNSARLRQLRKDVARIKTEQKMRAATAAAAEK